MVAGIQILECCEMALLTCWDILLGENQMVCERKTAMCMTRLIVLVKIAQA